MELVQALTQITALFLITFLSVSIYDVFLKS
jgi:hypothetical protein